MELQIIESRSGIFSCQALRKKAIQEAGGL